MKLPLSARLFLSFWLIYAIYATPAGGVTPNRYVDLTHALVNEGRFEIDTYHDNTIDKAYYDGHYYAGALPGPSVLAVPAYVVFKGLYAITPAAIKELAGGMKSYKVDQLTDSSFYGQVDNVEYFLSQWFLVITVVAAVTALSNVVFFKITRRLGAAADVAFWLTIAFGLGTICFWHATWFFEQAFTVFCVLTAFYCLLRLRQTQVTSLGLMAAGSIAGGALLMEFSGAFAGVMLFAYLVLWHRRPTALWFGVGYAVPVLLLMGHNYLLFDDPFSTAYQHLAGEEYIAVVSEGLVGVSYPRLERIVGLLLSPERGLWVFAPVTLWGGWGLVQPSARRTRFALEAVACALLIAAGLLFVGSFRGWNAGGAFGPRYLMFSLPFWVLPAAFAVRRAQLLPFGLSVAVAVLINWAGVQYGFAEHYYQAVHELFTLGPTLPMLEAIESHQVGAHWLLNLSIQYQSLWGSLVALVLGGGLGWWWRAPYRVLTQIVEPS
jgi:hypothetical protein